jgi:hypothetical protein
MIPPPSHSSSNHNDNSSLIDPNLSSPIIMSILQKPFNYDSLIPEEQTSSMPCHLPCCSHKQSTKKSSAKRISSNERMVYPPNPTQSSLKSAPPQTRPSPKSSSSINSKQCRIGLSPYPPTKTYFAPLSVDPYSQIRVTNEPSHNTDVYRPIPPAVLQNTSTLISPPNTPNGLRLPYICTRSITFAQAIIEHNCDMDKIPKLVVRHTKTYLMKKFDTMGQLYPTWFNEPDYRCIHCFSCDHVFTPQSFMTHVDDEQVVNEKPLHMTSIELLTSEKMSDYKVGL